MNDTSLITVFMTGLITGGLSCIAVQGGLLAATLAQRTEARLKEQVMKGQALPIFSFLLAKLVAYTLLGAFLGLLGSAFQLSLTTRIILQFAVVIFMIGTALSILNIHPIFRYFVIQPPRFLTRFIRKQSKSSDMFAPAILGVFTVFIPCGTTQAMMALAVASSSPLSGALIMFAFVLGTSPVFFLLGYFATKLGDVFQQKFMKIAAYAIILLAVFNANNAFALTGSNFTLEKVGTGVWCVFSFCDTSISENSQAVANVSEATITIDDKGYSPSNLSVKAGSQVTLHLINKGGGGCAQAFTLPKFGIQKIVPTGNSDTVTFTAPNTPGTQLAFMCSMGMYRGTINVI